MAKPNWRIWGTAAGIFLGLWAVSAALDLSSRTWGQETQAAQPEAVPALVRDEAGSENDENSSISGATQSASDDEVEPLAEPATPAAATTALANAELTQEIREIILNCTRGVQSLSGVSSADEFRSLDEFLSKAVVPRGGREIERYVQFENVHIKSPTGEVLRLHARPNEFAEIDDEEVLELQVYGVDKENLPVPMQLPSNLEGLPWSEAMSRFKAQGETMFEESSVSESWDDESGARVIRRNGQVAELEVFFERGALACSNPGADAKVSCRCF